jgi:hypothetical protein
VEATLGHEQPQPRGVKQSSNPPFNIYRKNPAFLASSKNSRKIKTNTEVLFRPHGLVTVHLPSTRMGSSEQVEETEQRYTK